MNKLNYYIVYHSTVEESFSDSIPNDIKVFTKVGSGKSKIKKNCKN